MKRSTYIWSIIALTILQLPAAHDAGREASAVAKPQAVKAYGQLPLSFEANQGQTDQRVKFLSHGSGCSLFLTGDEAVLALKKPGGSTARDRQPKPAVPSAEPSAVVRMKLVGANPAAKVTGLAELPGKSNYFIGNNPKKWRSNVPNYAKVKYTSVYPGVDLVYYGNQGQLEYDFVVQPGADPRQIQLDVGTGVRIDGSGDLVVNTDGGEVTFHKPLVYQPPKDRRRRTRDLVDDKYLLTDARVTFEVARYDRERPLVIDPTLAYSTYLGGSGGDSGNGVAVDASGNAYIVGWTSSSNFPTTPGAFRTTYPGADLDAFVSKLNATGSAIVYSTYLGGSGRGREAVGNGIAVDALGNAYIVGWTSSSNFPTTPGAFKTALDAPENAFVSKLSPAGSALLYSTYLGGRLGDLGAGIAVDALGHAYVTGETGSGFPTTPGAFQTTYGGGPSDAFITKLNATGSDLIYSTYLGGGTGPDPRTAGFDTGNGVAVDASGDAYITGFTGSSDLPTTPGAFLTSLPSSQSAFVTRLSADGSALVYSTYLGGSGFGGLGIAVNASGNAYVTGDAYPGFPTTPGAFQTTFGGGVEDAFLCQLNAVGSALVYSTYLGGNNDDVGYGVAVDVSGNAYVTGLTSSTGFPTTPGAFQTTYGGGQSDAFFTMLKARGSALLYSNYLGGSATDVGNAIAIGSDGNAYVTGYTASSNFPTTSGAFQIGYGGNGDAFVSKFSLSPVTLSPSSLNFGAQLIGTASSPKTVTLTNTGDATLDISSIGISGPSSSFSQTNNCGSSLLAGESCNIAVTFRPTSTRTCAETGTLTVNDTGGVQTVKLSGAGTVVTLSVKSLNFGNQPVGTTSSAKTITMTNHATSRVVSIAAISISGLNSPAFAQTNTCGTSLAAGANCTLGVTFTPHSIGSKTATLNVWNNGGAGALKVTLTGNGS